MKTLIILCLLVIATTNATVIRGPPVATKNNIFLVRRMGEEVKLICPIDGKPAPKVDWRKDGERIEEYLWPRFRPNRRNLKIKDAELGDSGQYLCHGVNGFGSAEIVINLIIIDPDEYPELAEGELPELSPPVLTQETINSREDYELRFGDSITLSCSADGKPAPSIVWYKDGVEFSYKVKQTGPSDSELRLINLTADESGIYTCSARNLAGEVNKEFRLAVRTTVPESPVFYTMPTNQTVVQGGRATLDCRVHSNVPTTIKWLKKLEGRMRGGKASEVIDVGEQSYSIITRQQAVKEPSTYRVGNNVYMSRLELDHVTVTDGGMYICFVTNSLGGFNYKQAFLTVVAKESPLVLALSISLAALTLFILTALVICLVRNRHNKKAETSVRQDSSEVRSTLICPQQTLPPIPQTPTSAPPPSLDSLYTPKSGSINTAPLPPPPTPVQWLYNNGGSTAAPSSTALAVSNGNNSGGSSSVYTDSSQFGIGGNTYEVPRYTSAGYGQHQRSSPLGQPAYIYGGYRH